jgi:hypothetical protein
MGAEAAASPCRAAGVVVIRVIACDKREAFAQGATGSRECAPDDRLREAIHYAVPEMDCFVAETVIGGMRLTRWLLAQTLRVCRRDDGNDYRRR